jgi:hypothetical protein
VDQALNAADLREVPGLSAMGQRRDFAAVAVAARSGNFVPTIHPFACKAHPGQPLQAWAILQTGRTPMRPAQSQPVQG